MAIRSAILLANGDHCTKNADSQRWHTSNGMQQHGTHTHQVYEIPIDTASHHSAARMFVLI
jgi:hypothetical protein